MIQDQLLLFLEQLKIDLIDSLQANGRQVSLQTAGEIEIIQTNGTATLQVPGYLPLLESGRKPTSLSPVQGDVPMIQRILQWCRDKGIPDKAAWAIKKSIDKHGYKGTPGIISIPLGNDNINLRLTPVLNNIAGEIIDQLLQHLV